MPLFGGKKPSQKRDCGPGFNQAATHSYTEVDTGRDSENVLLEAVETPFVFDLYHMLEVVLTMYYI